MIAGGRGRSSALDNPIRVAVLTPSTALRTGLQQMLGADERITLVAAGSRLSELPEVGEGALDVLIITPAAARGVGLAEALEPAGPVAVLILAEDDRGELPELPPIRGQPWGLLPLDVEAETLAAAVIALFEGLAVAPPEWLSRRAQRREAGAEKDGGAGEALTPRESEVLAQLALGLTNKQIALTLGISEHTVKYHISSIYAKLGVMNRAEAVRVGVGRGWIAV